MFDVALASAGSQVVLATSHDDKHPPEHIIDGNTDTFWVTTGMFPQEFIVTFTKMMSMKNIELSTHNVRKLCIERSVQHDPVDFEPLKEIELDSSEGQLQMGSADVGSVTAVHLRVVIESGYDHFVSVHKLHVDGAAVPN
ncbi:intraflagellar transport protein 25 homolog [Liolophura sinensis]|uniref:intraflagellar transport protein 25 homolog n=1 Tax=Liolophura sinensis TaxID=3198878 RepID=UPI00315828F8